ncbi:MAG: leishmanolysin-related zinc metalloendopeptidase [Roseovarius sp.]|nr:leishmanolysin-related zinc metalloendopeptidase [Roseovarius sp.]
MVFQYLRNLTSETGYHAQSFRSHQVYINDEQAASGTSSGAGYYAAPEQRTMFNWSNADVSPLVRQLIQDALQTGSEAETDNTDAHLPVDHFEFSDVPADVHHTSEGLTEVVDRNSTDDTDSVSQSIGVVVANVGDGRPEPDPDPTPGPGLSQDSDPDPAPPPIVPEDPPEPPTQDGRPAGVTPGTPTVAPPSPPPGEDNASSGRPDDAMPDPPPTGGPVTSYTSGGPAATSYNVTIDFVGTWTSELQASFIDAADYLSTIILADIPDTIVDGVAIDDITITATLEGIDGVGGVLGSAGPRDLRGDGTYLPSTGAMTFDSADAQNQLGLGNWESIVLHEMMHALGFGTLWSLMGLTTGSVAGGDIRFTGQNATDTYQTEFPGIAGSDAGSLLGVPVEADGGPGTAGGHWDELIFDEEIMTGYVDTGSFVSVMTIASFEDMGYDTVFDNPYSATDLFGPIPADPLMDLFA